MKISVKDKVIDVPQAIVEKTNLFKEHLDHRSPLVIPEEHWKPCLNYLSFCLDGKRSKDENVYSEMATALYLESAIWIKCLKLQFVQGELWYDYTDSSMDFKEGLSRLAKAMSFVYQNKLRKQEGKWQCIYAYQYFKQYYQICVEREGCSWKHYVTWLDFKLHKYFYKDYEYLTNRLPNYNFLGKCKWVEHEGSRIPAGNLDSCKIYFFSPTHMYRFE